MRERLAFMSPEQKNAYLLDDNTNQRVLVIRLGLQAEDGNWPEF